MANEMLFNSYIGKTGILSLKNNNCNKSGVFMLKKDFILCNLMSKEKHKHFEMKDKIIIKLNKKIDKDNLREALKIKRINEIVESLYRTLPKIKENQPVKRKTPQNKFFDFTKISTQPKLNAKAKIKCHIKSQSNVSIKKMKINPLEDTIQYKLTKYKEQKIKKYSSIEMFQSISLTTNDCIIQSTSSSMPIQNEKKHFKSNSINMLNENYIFRTSIHFNKDNFKNKCRAYKLIKNNSPEQKLIYDKCFDYKFITSTFPDKKLIENKTLQNKLIECKLPDHNLSENKYHFPKLIENNPSDHKQIKNNKKKSEIIDNFFSVYVDKSITGW